MPVRDTNAGGDAMITALSALAWTLGDGDRAERLLAVTGLTPEDLRQRADDPAVLVGVLGFLEAHEPDLIACAEALDLSPQRLIVAREALS